MVIYTEKMLKQYLENDWILKLLLEAEKDIDRQVRTHQWIKEMDNKRLIFAEVYGDLLRCEKSREEKRKIVLDIGGGYSSLTRKLVSDSDYRLLDFIAHGGQEAIGQSEKDCGTRFWINEDWMEYDISQRPCDIIIANDIFPDVDQRLELFIEKYLPYCHEMRLVLTFYNDPRYYRTKRVDDAEILTFLSWDGEITGMKMKKYRDRIIDTEVDELDRLKDVRESIFRNGRQVAYVRLRGEGRG